MAEYEIGAGSELLPGLLTGQDGLAKPSGTSDAQHSWAVRHAPPGPRWLPPSNSCCRRPIWSKRNAASE